VETCNSVSSLMEEDQIRRHIWKLAQVEGLRPGRDGVARTVLLRTTHGSQIARPIQQVIPLEIGTDQGGEDDRVIVGRNVTLTLKTRIVGAAVVVEDCDVLKFVRWQPCSRIEIINGNSVHVQASFTLARNSTFFQVLVLIP
jgi:hypothetical protein